MMGEALRQEKLAGWKRAVRAARAWGEASESQQI